MGRGRRGVAGAPRTPPLRDARRRGLRARQVRREALAVFGDRVHVGGLAAVDAHVPHPN